MIWNHYSEAKYQDESMIAIYESWYGQGKNGSSNHSKYWDNPEHKEEGYERTLGYIQIDINRTDYESTIYINVRNGNVSIHAVYVDREIKRQPIFYYGTTDVTNWMLENNLLIFDSNDESSFPMEKN